MTEYLRLDLHGLLNIAAGIFNISVGCFVLFKNPQSRLNRSFFFVTMTAFFWVMGLGMLSLVRNEEDAYLWLRVLYTGVPFIAPSVYLLSATWRDPEKPVPALVFGLSVATALAAWIFLTPRLIYTMADKSYGRFFTLNPNAAAISFYVVLITTFIAYAYSSVRNFYWCWKHAPTDAQRQQSKGLLIAFCVAYVGSVDFLVKLNVNLYPGGYLCLTLLIGLIAYLILKHRFFDINLALKKIGLITAVYAVLLLFTTPLIFWLGDRLNLSFPPDQLPALIAAFVLLLLVLSLGPTLYAFLVNRTFWLKTNVTTGLVHELKSPIGAIRGAMEILRDHPNENLKAEYLSIIDRNTSRLEQFVGDLLKIAKVQEGNILVDRTMMDLGQLVHEAWDLHKPMASAKGIDLDLNLKSPVVLQGDSEKVRQAISNIFSNAIKYSDHGRIRVSIEKTGKAVLFSVSDQGRGIAADDLPRIFDRFYQGNHGFKGAGIGLAIAKAWVEAHGGRIWAESKGEGKGTTIRFTVPVGGA